MGAPNVVRGGSHSGNIAAKTLGPSACWTVLSSDYIPASLLVAAFELARRIEGYGVACRTQQCNAAAGAGYRLTRSRRDRRRTARGPVADWDGGGSTSVREVYRGGRRAL
jgi:alpha-D-ribose 1-methylphosphonate 5-triphosphate diphosphatase